MRTYLVLSIFFINPLAIAGTETHGGDLIACYDRPLLRPNGSVDNQAKIVKLELKDYWEGKSESVYKFLPPRYDQVNYWKNAETVLFNFSRLDHEMATRLETRLNGSFKDSIRFVEEGELPEVDDASSILNIAAGSNCYDRQLAVQKSGLGVGRYTIFIARNLFEALDIVNKTGILLHELLLEDYLKNGKHFKKNSSGKVLTNPIRYLNYLMVSSIYEGKNKYYEYLNLLYSQDLLYFEEVVFNFQGHLFKISNSDFLKNYPEITATNLKKYQQYPDASYLELNYMDSDLRGKTSFSINPNSTLTFDLEKNKLIRATIVGDYEVNSSIFEGQKTQHLTIQNSQRSDIKFFQGMVVSELRIFKNSRLQCESKYDGDKNSFSREVESSDITIQLSSPEYIYSCDIIKK